MTDHDTSGGLPVEVIGPATRLTIDELCIACNVPPDWVVGLVEQGAIEVVGPTGQQARQEWRFTRLSLVRVAKARRLERDLGLNLPGVALALDLIDQLDELRARLSSLEGSSPSPR
jgi:chaperone modulatory protein CbpM